MFTGEEPLVRKNDIIKLCEEHHECQLIVRETGAKSTDLQSPETAEHLCTKCEEYARNWKPCADKLWSETKVSPKSYENYKNK